MPDQAMFAKVLVANRGVIACRILRTLRRMGVAGVAVYSEADVGSLHVLQADEAIAIGPGPAAQSYLNVEAMIAAAKAAGAEAIHPGYGFLSENRAFAERCAREGLVFIGPTPENIGAFGLKHSARALATQHGVPLAPGSGLLTDADEARGAAAAIGYPVMLKATAGGGGIGMTVCAGPDDIVRAFDTVARLGAGNFGDGGVFLERYVEHARHIEVQVFGDGEGRVVALGERDCSLQRRNQKVVEETPAPHLPEATRRALIDCALRLTAGARYRSAGTVEFLYDGQRDDFFFLEVNTRLQVEHGVTEQVTGVDLVEWMVRGAAGDYRFMDAGAPPRRGASLQVRLYAEDPAQQYRPSSGRLIEVVFPAPAQARVETWVTAGTEVSAHYDPMLAKLIVTADDRAGAVRALQAALDDTRLAGIETNLAWLRAVVRSQAFVAGEVSTRALDAMEYAPRALQVLAGGASTTVQDWPGRIGYWNVGVPPSGPMDSLSFRLGNRLLGNDPSAAGLELTAAGPTLRFGCATRFVLTGAAFDAQLDGAQAPPWRVHHARAGQTLKIGRVSGAGIRGYLLLAGGVDVPLYLGSRAAFTLGEFGGHAGRAVMAGDTLHLAAAADEADELRQDPPEIGDAWELRVLYGPHGAPEFFTVADIEMIVGTAWSVHYNSSRTGVRLVGPKPAWARTDGGEAGLHPSNIHDNAYVVGAVDFTGDMPIILGPDGPSLGGFVCPFVVIAADLWKLGQLAPGATLRFRPVSDAEAVQADLALESWIESPQGPSPAISTTPAAAEPVSSATANTILRQLSPNGVNPAVVYRRQGDGHVLVEYGPIALDLELRLRVHALMLEIEALDLPGIVETTPGIRSLQVRYDRRVLGQSALLDVLVDIEHRLDALEDVEIPSRIVHLPLSWDDPAVRETIEKYAASVRDDAPWCPDNIEFIRRINGLAHRDDVRRIVFDAAYLVMGLGDVYLGAPVATPLDPRHRLVTTKYNPARTWTPPNVVGIGGAYMCIYGMEGPGGYQLFGRTLQVWNSWRQTEAFTDGKPWLLRFFDQIRFFPVSAQELSEWRRDFPLGRRSIKIEPTVLRLSDYRAFLADNADGIAAFEANRRRAFDGERGDWAASGELDRAAALSVEVDAVPPPPALALPAGAERVEAPFGGMVWQLLAREGDRVAQGQTIAIIEAMKMESPVVSPIAGVLHALYVGEKQQVSPGTPLFSVAPAP